MTETAIIKGCLEQDRTCQKALYERYCKQMYAVCLRYHSDSDLAKEAMQRGFIKVYKYLNKFSNKGSLQAWIKSIIIRTCIDVLNERKKLKYGDLEISNFAHVAEHEEESIAPISYNQILAILDQLPTGYRTVFSMNVLDGLKHEEIGSYLKISTATSRSQLRKARIMMQALLKKQYGHLLIKE